MTYKFTDDNEKAEHYKKVHKDACKLYNEKNKESQKIKRQLKNSQPKNIIKKEQEKLFNEYKMIYKKELLEFVLNSDLFKK